MKNKTIKQINEGCGKDFKIGVLTKSMYNPIVNKKQICGGYGYGGFSEKKELCPICQAKKSQRIWDLNDELEFLKSLENKYMMGIRDGSEKGSVKEVLKKIDEIKKELEQEK